MIKNVLLFYITYFLICFESIAQCAPEFATSCNNAYVFCSLDALNGYTCANTSMIPGHCPMPCSQGGVAHNTNWLAFVSDGGTKTFTLTIGTCVTFQGLQFGIWGDCSCTEEVYCYSIPCAPPSSVQAFSVDLLPCKTYYMWIDGCSGDICDFTINTSGGGLGPPLSVLGFINNIDSMIIEPVCVGTCNYRFFIEPQSGSCTPNYVWTLDGDEIAANSNEIFWDFPDEGDFTLCVTISTGNPSNASFCTQIGPRCAVVKVRPIPDRMGADKVICWEQVNPGGYKLHSQRIFQSGKYREQFTDTNCCKFDSVWCVTVLDQPVPPDVYYITCDNSPYIDATGRSWAGCRNHFQIPIPKSTDPYLCDSSILLTSVQVNYESKMSSGLENGFLFYQPNIRISKPCNVGETYFFQYAWRDKVDTTGRVISNDERLLVPGSGQYIVDVSVLCVVGNDSAYCLKSFQEEFDESVLLPVPQISSIQNICPFDTAWAYGQSAIMDPAMKYHWIIKGGVILSNPDSSAIQILWNNIHMEEPYLSLTVSIDSIFSPATSIFLSTTHSGVLPKDFSVFGKSSTLKVNSTLPGLWSIISGPHSAFIEVDSQHFTRVHVESFGTYCFEWLAELKNCQERDTLCIQFKDIITYDDKEERKHERDSLKGKLVSRYTKDIEPTYKIESIGSDYVSFTFDNKISDLSEIGWFDLQGKQLSNSDNKIEINENQLKVYTPEISGLYFLKMKIDSELFIHKIFVMKN